MKRYRKNRKKVAEEIRIWHAYLYTLLGESGQEEL